MLKKWTLGALIAGLFLSGCSLLEPEVPELPKLAPQQIEPQYYVFEAKPQDRMIFEYHQGKKITRKSLTLTNFPYHEQFHNCNLSYFSRQKNEEGKSVKKQITYTCPSDVTIYKDVLDENRVLFNGEIVFLKYKAVRQGNAVYYAPMKVSLKHEPDPKYFNLGVSGRTINEGKNDDIGPNMIVYYLKANREYRFAINPPKAEPTEVVTQQ